MSEQPFASLEACFGDLPDPRVQGRFDHFVPQWITLFYFGYSHRFDAITLQHERHRDG